MQEFNGTLSLKVSREDTLGAKRNPMRANKWPNYKTIFYNSYTHQSFPSSKWQEQ
jgi:hypothetical protein